MDKDGRRSMFRSYLRSSLPDDVTDLTNARHIPVARLSPNPFQPRSEEEFEPAALGELAASIREHGVLQPLLVRQTPGAEDTYQIAAGERRWRAARLATFNEVPCVVQELTDRQMREMALVENVFREDLSPVDLAHALGEMMEVFALSARALSERLGKNHSYVDDKLKIVRDPRIAAAVKIGALGPTVALEIAEMDDERTRADLLARAEQGERLKVKDVRTATQERVVPVKPAAASSSTSPSSHSEARDNTVEAPVKPAVMPPLRATPSAAIEPMGASMDDIPSTTNLGQVHLRDLRIVQLREGRDSEPRQLDTADKATVLRIMHADLAWLERDGAGGDT